MRTCPRKAGFFTLKRATNLIHFSWSKTVEIGEKEEEVQTDQGAGNDDAMGVLFSPEDGEALDEQLVGSIDDEEGDMRPLNLDFGDADVNDDDDDGLRQTSKTNKQRCQCCHIFDSSQDQKGNLQAVYVCECKEEGVTALKGACDKTMYCYRCWHIMHYRESFSANIAHVEKWLDNKGSKSTRTKASSCNASSIGSSRSRRVIHKRLLFP